MALREALEASSGELMREDAITGGCMTRIFATVGVVGGVLFSRPFCSIHSAPRVFSCCHATFAWLWEPASEPQNIVAYDS
ncbi:hypothetical protein CY35_17G052000 [Sphagnum magellanicum]|nr:hypothetical protein CY35_17G052000 [Sphagnum magellanicum]